MKRLTSAQLFAPPKTARKTKARLARAKLVIVAARERAGERAQQWGADCPRSLARPAAGGSAPLASAPPPPGQWPPPPRRRPRRRHARQCCCRCRYFWCGLLLAWHSVFLLQHDCGILRRIRQLSLSRNLVRSESNQEALRRLSATKSLFASLVGRLNFNRRMASIRSSSRM